MKKLKNAIKAVSILQLVMFSWAVYILIDAGREGAHKMDGLGVILPGGIYIVLGVLNIVLSLSYGYFVLKGRVKLDRWIAILLLLVVLLTVFSPQIFSSIETQI